MIARHILGGREGELVITTLIDLCGIFDQWKYWCAQELKVISVSCPRGSMSLDRRMAKCRSNVSIIDTRLIPNKRSAWYQHRGSPLA